MTHDDDDTAIEEAEAIVEAIDQPLDKSKLIGTSSRPGTFKFGPDERRGSCRGRGRPNRITRDIRHGLIESAIEHGSDGKGKDGLKGFFRFLLANDLRSYAALIGRCLPLQAKIDVDSTSNVTFDAGFNVNVIAVPAGVHLSSEQQAMLRDAKREELPALLASFPRNAIREEPEPPPEPEPEPEPIDLGPSNVTRIPRRTS